VVVGAGSASAGGHIDLSLRASRGADGGCAQGGAAQAEVCSVGDCAAGSVVWGYVKSCSQKGLFVSLGRGVDARVLLSNLSDAFVKAPAEVFPPGTRVQGRVLSADPKSGRLELSLKASDVSAQQLLKLQDLSVGQLVRGVVKRVEPYGVFVSLDGSALVGMCHISMFSDERVKSLPQRVAPGKRVRAKVIAADVDAGRLSLGMKTSLFEGEEEEEEEEELQQADPLTAGDDAAMEDAPQEDEEAMEVEEIQPKVRLFRSPQRVTRHSLTPLSLRSRRRRRRSRGSARRRLLLRRRAMTGRVRTMTRSCPCARRHLRPRCWRS